MRNTRQIDGMVRSIERAVGAGAVVGTLMAGVVMAGGCGDFSPAVGALRDDAGQGNAVRQPPGDGGRADGSEPDSAAPVTDDDDSGVGDNGGYTPPGYP